MKPDELGDMGRLVPCGMRSTMNTCPIFKKFPTVIRQS